MKKYALFALPAAALLALVIVAGCNSSNPTPTPPDPAKIATAIQVGTESAIAVGFVAIPDQTQANQAATLADQVISTNILPILNGDDAGIIAGLNQILDLSAFDSNPLLAKAKLVLEAGMPLLQSYLPPDLAQTGKLPPEVKAYLIAFFTGADNGCKDYLGNAKGMRAEKDFSSYADLRAKLAK